VPAADRMLQLRAFFCQTRSSGELPLRGGGPFG
jgi:hypothetical protein